MSENFKYHSKRLRTIAWIATSLTCLLIVDLYFVESSVIEIFSNMFSGMGVDLPLPTRIVIGARPFLALLFLLAAILVLAKELYIQDKAISLAITTAVVLVVAFACSFISASLYLPLQRVQQIIK